MKILTIKKNQHKTITVEKIEDSKIVLEEGANLTFILFALAGNEVLQKLTFEFAGRESSLNFLGFIIGNNKDKFILETVAKHKVPGTKAYFRLRAAMFGSSVVDFKGNIIIDPKAQLTDSYLSHDTLLLSPTARAKSVPALEIEADDVKAGHAATIGKVDEEAIFYLKSRGIDEKTAEQILIEGFFDKQLKMIEDLDLRKDLSEKILKSLPII